MSPPAFIKPARRRFLHTLAAAITLGCARKTLGTDLAAQKHGRPGSAGFVFDPGWSGTVPMESGGEFDLSYARGNLGFAADPRALLYFDGSTFSNNSTYARASFRPIIQSNASLDATLKPVGSPGSLLQRWPIGGKGTAAWMDNDPMCTINGKSLTYMKRMYGMTFKAKNENNYNDKMMRYWPPSGSGFETPDSIQTQRPSYPTCNTEGVDDPSARDGADTSRSWSPLFRADAWLVWRHFFRDSSAADAFDGIMQIEEQGLWAFAQTKRHRTKTIGRNRQSGAPLDQTKTRVFFNQFSGGGDAGDVYPPSGSTLRATEIWSNDKFAHIFMSDMLKFQSALLPDGGKEYQHEIWLPTRGSDSTVSGTGRFGVHTGRSGRAVWVCTESMQHIRVGVYV